MKPLLSLIEELEKLSKDTLEGKTFFEESATFILNHLPTLLQHAKWSCTAQEALDSCWEHRCGKGLSGGCTAISASKLEAALASHPDLSDSASPL